MTRSLETRVDNSNDSIDSRDICERIEELENELDGPLMQQVECDQSELRTLRALVEEIDSCSGDTAKDGVQLIRDSAFEDHAQELAEDIGAIGRAVAWPYTCIDWEQAARELQQDYSSIDYDGVTYWVRS